MMKKVLFLICSLLLIPGIAIAAPFLVANPESVTLSTGQTITYNITGLPSSITATNVPADSTGTYAFKLDLSGIPAGNYTVTATACLNDPTWGQQCSAASSPFSFTVPASPGAPASLGIATK